MCGLRIIPVFLLFFLLTSCNEYQVEHCASGQGIVLDNDGVPLLGDETAPVEFVVFADFQCPGTHKLWWRLNLVRSKLAEQNKGDLLKIYFRHFPLSFHNRAQAAAVAASAAHVQGDDAFWSMADRLMKTGDELSDDHILMYASSAGLDMDQFQSDLESDKVASVVSRDHDLALDLALPGTPTALICGIPVAESADSIIANLEYLLDL